MKTKTVTRRTKLYRFSALSDKAKQRAKDDYDRESDGYHNAAEYMNTLTELADTFGAKITDYSINWNGGYSSVTFKVPCYGWPRNVVRDVLATLKEDDCPLTGWCYAYDAIEAFRKAFEANEDNVDIDTKTRVALLGEPEDDLDVEPFLQAAFRAVLKVAQADYGDFYTDETFGEHCDANDWWFKRDGELFR